MAGTFLYKYSEFGVFGLPLPVDVNELTIFLIVFRKTMDQGSSRKKFKKMVSVNSVRVMEEARAWIVFLSVT